MPEKFREVFVPWRYLAVEINDSTENIEILFWWKKNKQKHKTKPKQLFLSESLYNNCNTPSVSPMATCIPSPAGQYG